ncbi:MAG: hypothetical protein ABSE36_19795 [Terracidiphilus sp.]
MKENQWISCPTDARVLSVGLEMRRSGSFWMAGQNCERLKYIY